MSQGTGDRRRLGTAAWADPEWVAATYPYRDGSVWLGRLPNGAAVGYADDRHVCLVSGSRAGKGTSTIVNNLCTWPGSIVVIDPKGENATVTAARRGAGAVGCEGMGQAVHVLDPFKASSIDGALRSRFNPFDALDPHNEEAIDEAARLADALVVIHEEGKDPFWDESARALLKGLILHVLTAEEFEGRRNLNTLRQLVTRGDWETVEVLRKNGDEDIPPAQGLLWTGVQRNPAFGGIVAGIGDTFRSMLLNSPKQFESVLQVANRNTEFLDSPAMQRCVEASDFKLSDLKTSAKGLSLYLCLPQRYMNTHYRWLRMMIALVVSEMEIVRGRPATGHPVLVVLDEFAGLKRMEVIEHAVAQIAGYGVKLFFVLQSLEQLKATYKDNWETFLSNAGLKVFFSLDDHFSRDYVSKLIGETEVIRDVRSQSENVSESETYSESRSESFGTSESRSRSVTGGTNSSITESDTLGTNRSTSRSQGGSQTTNWREGFLWTHRTRNSSTGQNWSTSQTEGTSETHGVSRTQGSSSGWSDGVTAGTSRTVGMTTGSSRGVSRGQTAGSSETVHRRALIAPDEIGQMFARIDDPDDPCFPGLALAAISGKPPILLRRTNYYEDPQFIDCFMPHPDHPHRAAVTIDLGAETFVPFVTGAGSFDLTSWAVKRGDVVMPGQPLAQIGYVHERMALRSPIAARFIRTWEHEGRPPDVRLCSIVENDGGKFFGVQRYVSQGNLDKTIYKASGLVTLRAYENEAVVDPLVDFRVFARGMDGKIAVLLQRLTARATWWTVGAAAAALLLIRVFVVTGAGVGAAAPVVLIPAMGLYRYFAGKFAALNKARAEFRTLAVGRELVFSPVREPEPQTTAPEQPPKAVVELPPPTDAALENASAQIVQAAPAEDKPAPPTFAHQPVTAGADSILDPAATAIPPAEPERSPSERAMNVLAVASAHDVVRQEPVVAEPPTPAVPVEPPREATPAPESSRTTRLPLWKLAGAAAIVFVIGAGTWLIGKAKARPQEPETRKPIIQIIGRNNQAPRTPSTAEGVAGDGDVARTAASSGYEVQVLAPQSLEQARSVKQEMSSKGYRAYVLATSSGGPPFRVRIATPTGRKEDASALADQIRAEGKYSPLVVR